MIHPQGSWLLKCTESCRPTTPVKGINHPT
uniref:Uncharacterized protein n=1 Tax=Arundo donax TaxID=35708 RepID=A0A0A9H029_ARUDO